MKRSPIAALAAAALSLLLVSAASAGSDCSSSGTKASAASAGSGCSSSGTKASAAMTTAASTHGDCSSTSAKATAVTASSPAPGALPAVGQMAPAFSLPATSGGNVSLAQFRGKKTVVLYFYPKDETPGCTHEACDFRDHSAALQKDGVVILGVSNDDLTSHADFRKKEHLPFTLLSDTDAKVSREYGVYGTQEWYGKKWTGINRTTFVIDKEGRIAQVWPKVNVDGHVADVLKFVEKMQPTANRAS